MNDYTWNEIEQHNTPETAWIVIHNKVYDISTWQHHPGGSVMYSLAGKDATDTFAAFHSSDAYKQMGQFCIGRVKQQDQTEEEFAQGYRKLKERVRKLGLYKSNRAYYVGKFLSNFALFVTAVALCYAGTHFSSTYTSYGWIVQACGAVILGLFYQQCGWLAHDILHHQLFPSDHLYGDYLGILVGNICQGFSVSWWKRKHNMHHAIPNSLNHSSINQEIYIGDPDIDTMPLLAWSKAMTMKVRNAFGLWLIKYQSWNYFPILLFARISWLIQSFMHAFQFPRQPIEKVHHQRLEQFGLLIYCLWNIGILHFCSMNTLQYLMFFLVSQTSCGLFLALAFGLGHNGMATYDLKNQPHFFRLQVSTTRNITSSPLVDWFMGGLQYQVDHHLFPMIPRHNLPKLNILVKSFCLEYGIELHETGFWQGTFEVVNHLDAISKDFIEEFPAM